MAWITPDEVRERIPNVTSEVYGDAEVQKIILRAQSEIVASSGLYRDLMQGYVFGEKVSLATIGGNKRIEAKGGEDKAYLSMKPVVSGTLFLFKNASVQDYHHIKSNETGLLENATDYTIDNDTGIVTLLSTLVNGDELTATYQFTMDVENPAPQTVVELIKSLSAYYLAVAVYGNNSVSDGTELFKSYENAVEALNAMKKNKYSIPEFDNIDLVDLEDWQPSELKSSKIIRR